MKPIVCPECILSLEKSTDTENPEPKTEDEIKASVQVFTDWHKYAYHILKDHPESYRVIWVISCVNDEIQKCKKLGQELPQAVKELQDTIEQGKQLAESDEPIKEDKDLWMKLLKEFTQRSETPQVKPVVKQKWFDKIGIRKLK